MKNKSKAPIERMKRPKGERSRMGFPKVRVTGKFFHPALERLAGLEEEENANSTNNQKFINLMNNNNSFNMTNFFVYTVVDVVTNYPAPGGTLYRLLYLPYSDGGTDKYTVAAASAIDAESMGIPFCIELDDLHLQTTGLGASIGVWYTRSLPNGNLYPVRYSQIKP